MKKEDVKMTLVKFALFIGVLFVLYLYLPSENNDLTEIYKNVEHHKGVDFGGKIQNSPTKNRESQFVEITSPQLCSTSYAATGSFQPKVESRFNPSSASNYGVAASNSSSFGQKDVSHEGIRSTRFRCLHSAGSQQMSMSTGNSFGRLELSKEKNVGTNVNPQPRGFSSITTVFAINSTPQFEERTGLQRSQNNEDPPPSYAPLGDGYWLLLLFVGFYLVWKKRIVFLRLHYTASRINLRF